MEILLFFAVYSCKMSHCPNILLFLLLIFLLISVFIFKLLEDISTTVLLYCHFQFVRFPQFQYSTLPGGVDRLTPPTRCPMTLLWLPGVGKYVLSTAFAILHIREGDNAGRLQSNPKKPLFTFQWALLGEGETAKCVYLSTQFQLYFERPCPKTQHFGPSAPRLLSNRIMFDCFFLPHPTASYLSSVFARQSFVSTFKSSWDEEAGSPAFKITGLIRVKCLMQKTFNSAKTKNKYVWRAPPTIVHNCFKNHIKSGLNHCFCGFSQFTA